MKSIRRWAIVAVPLGVWAIEACVGDDPSGSPTDGADGGASSTSSSSSGGSSGASSSSSSSSGGSDSGVDAGPKCGYPGEDCCEAPALACRPGTTCGTSNKKCMINEVRIVGSSAESTSGGIVQHVKSVRWDGAAWAFDTMDVLPPVGGFSGWNATSLFAVAPDNYRATLVMSSDGKMQRFTSGTWSKCEVGQSCVGPTTPTPPLWSVAVIGNDTWIGATNEIYRCASGSNACVSTTTGLEATTWATGTLTGTSGQDIWYSATTRAFHFDGTKWTIHDNIQARAIFQVRKDDVWVGDKTFQHWDGTKWSDPLGIDGAPVPGMVMAISGSASDDLWAVGADNTNAFSAHWNGTKWSLVPLPANAADLRAIYAPSRIEAYAVSQTTVYRWDGTKWSVMTLPSVDGGLGEPTWDAIDGPARPRP